jgi:RNA polymerase sigma factor (sigma-70 family)
MARRQLDTLIQLLRRGALAPATDRLSDGRLLDRFVQRGDGAAFEVLVWRHGSMMLNVCSRVLRHAQDAEDAFQATFLALARKAASISRRESVAGWLHRVAYRVALRARSTVSLLPLPDEPASDPSAGDPVAELIGRELGAAFDEEVNRLPQKYRVAFVLCQVEGQTIEEAARALGCPAGTIGVRVARARDLLRRRLSRRGYSSPPTAARTAPPAALVGTTVKAALLGTAGQAAAVGVISTNVATMTRGVLRAMFLTRCIQSASAALGLGLLGLAALLAHRTQAEEPARAAASQAAHPPSRKSARSAPSSGSSSRAGRSTRK